MGQIITYPDNHEPDRFTTAQLDWLPWIAPLDEAALTDRHYEGLVDRSRSKSAYFRLLARDPEVLGARTRTDKDIFYSKGGLPRAERELAAAAVSRLNGCIYCASVHARFSIQFSKDDGDVTRLLERGTDAVDKGRNGAVVRTAVALTRSPAQFGEADIAALDDAGFKDDEIVDLIQAAAFFNWANRLMLSLGEPQES
ncbi:alkylhydroperoxidase domain protein [Paenirhodobacter populi]|uniref:Alkylhydroperoxidase domain protein n=1 Tax=Paenirhodobacter populi TaxID=2306993 RepID=A0A443JAQ1_9RHOB|nr:alkylhydroperoxidase domain protein [Sinirhodobacter populi]RWR05234.1 alkylhydroperoxidase domain protein [Sinirhodobacter populi]RWR17469.1 alkylhydroperoxidase domain protein [Sinirhodobacter populi]